MASRFLTAKNLGLISRPFYAKTLSLSLRHLSLSTTTTVKTLINLSQRPFPPPPVVLSLLCQIKSNNLVYYHCAAAAAAPARVLTEKVKEMLFKVIKDHRSDVFHEYDVELEKIYDEFEDATDDDDDDDDEDNDDDDDDDEVEVEDEVEDEVEVEVEDKDDNALVVDNDIFFSVFHLKVFFWNLSDQGKHVNELLDWFEKETSKAKEITEMFRKDLESIMKDTNYKDETELVEVLEEMYWTLFDNHEKAIRAKAPEPKDNNQTRYLKCNPVSDWQSNDFNIELNKLLDWFDNETMEANDLTKKLRKEHDAIIAKLSAKELDDMFWNLKYKQSNAIIAKAKAYKLADEQAMAAKLLYPLFVV